jgi:putative transposase
VPVTIVKRISLLKELLRQAHAAHQVGRFRLTDFNEQDSSNRLVQKLEVELSLASSRARPVGLIGIVRLSGEDVVRLFMWHTPRMRTRSPYHRHRFPAEIISHSVWLYFRFALSFRDVEEMLAMRGVVLTYETVREWCLKFGQTYANDLRRRSPRPGDKWHLDEVFLKINGRIHYLWRAVDQDGDVLDILVQSKRDKKAAKKFFRKLLKRLQYVPSLIVTDKLRSYGPAKAAVLPSVEHRQQKHQNNRAENSHQPTRLRDETIQVTGPRAAFSLGLRNHFLTLPSGKTSVQS